MVAIIYIAMLVFDVAVLAGFVFLIGERGWSPWWLLFALVVMLGSNPRLIIEGYYRVLNSKNSE